MFCVAACSVCCSETECLVLQLTVCVAVRLSCVAACSVCCSETECLVLQLVVCVAVRL